MSPVPRSRDLTFERSPLSPALAPARRHGRRRRARGLPAPSSRVRGVQVRGDDARDALPELLVRPSPRVPASRFFFSSAPPRNAQLCDKTDVLARALPLLPQVLLLRQEGAVPGLGHALRREERRRAMGPDAPPHPAGARRRPSVRPSLLPPRRSRLSNAPAQPLDFRDRSPLPGCRESARGSDRRRRRRTRRARAAARLPPRARGPSGGNLCWTPRRREPRRCCWTPRRSARRRRRRTSRSARRRRSRCRTRPRCLL